MLTSNFHLYTPLSINLYCRRPMIQNKSNKEVNKYQKVQSLALARTQYHDTNNPRTVDFRPCIWANRFLEYASLTVEDGEDTTRHAQKLKAEIKGMVTSSVIEPSEKLELIDMIQRLGLSYHFENEISESFQSIHVNCKNDYEDNLHITALRFRLFRQQGYNVSCDVFDRYKDHEGKLNNSCVNDPQGLLSLYEASQLRVHGEKFLEEALSVTKTLLESLAARENPTFAARINHALKWPVGKVFPRLEARQNLEVYKANSSRERIIIEFAKIDFNRVQRVHQRELSQMTVWWNDLNFAEKLPFARERIVESYFWALSAYFEPQYSLARVTLTKVVVLLTAIDDIFDSYGAFEELELFAEAFQRCDIADINMLPGYMKPCYKAILDLYDEIETSIDFEKKLRRANYVKEAMQSEVRANFSEAKWFHHQYIPKMEEYMEVASITVGYSSLATAALAGMVDITTEGTLEWISSRPTIVRTAEIIIRLMNDIASHKSEQSGVGYYMKQHGTSRQETLNEFHKQITNAWKDINQECLNSTVPIHLLQRILGLARAANIFYQKEEEDGYTNGAAIESYMVSLFIDPITS